MTIGQDELFFIKDGKILCFVQKKLVFFFFISILYLQMCKFNIKQP